MSVEANPSHRVAPQRHLQISFPPPPPVAFNNHARINKGLLTPLTPDHSLPPLPYLSAQPTVQRTPGKQRWSTGAHLWSVPSSLPSVDMSPPQPNCEDKNIKMTWRSVSPPNEGPGIAKATPFLPGITGGIWTPPGCPTSLESDDKELQIRILKEEIERLVREKDSALSDNARLVTEVKQLSIMATRPPRSSAPPGAGPFMGGFSCPVPAVGFGDAFHGPVSPVGLALRDLRLPPDVPVRSISAETTSGYRPAQITVDLIMSGKVDYVRMDPRSESDLLRPLVWTIAHQEPKNNVQAANLKNAANALGTRLSASQPMLVTRQLISAILEFAKLLCFTSNGNYLCQQLLEKGTADDKINFIKAIESDIIPIANNKFGAHVLVKAISVKELEDRICDALFAFGVFESMQTGARKVWRPHLGKCRNTNETDIFERIKNDMTGRWADLCVANENGSISVQQVFEGCANQDLIDACFKEILEDISRIANNQFGHFVVNKLLNFQEPIIKAVSCAILTAYPPLATNHHGVQFVEIVLNSNRILLRAHLAKYLEALCCQEAGRTPAIVAVANSSVGRGHLLSVLRQVPPGERVLMSRIHNTCRQFQTTLRNSQSGNELLRSLGIINTPARRG